MTYTQLPKNRITFTDNLPLVPTKDLKIFKILDTDKYINELELELYFSIYKNCCFCTDPQIAELRRGGLVVNCSIYRQPNTHTITNKNKTEEEGMGERYFSYKKSNVPFFLFSLFFLFHFFPFALLSFARLIICPSSFLLLCLFGRYRRSHHAGEARLVMPRAIWF